MKSKSIWLMILVMMTCKAFSQSNHLDTTGQNLPFDTAGKMSSVPPPGADTIQWTAVVTRRSSDTLSAPVSLDSAASKAMPVKAAPLKTDKRWFISPGLKFQAQDFGMLEKQRLKYLSNAETLSFIQKTNRSAAVSAYKNLNGHLSASLDLGVSMGHVTTKDSLIGTTKKSTYGLGAASVYYNLLGNQFRLQPFLAAGINALYGKQAYLSAPLGMGVKYSGKKIMIEGQASYGYSVSSNIANTLMYNLGIYFPLKSKKQKQEDEAQSGRKDTANVNITNITNNYYFYNRDSAKKAQDSLLANITKKRIRKEKELKEKELAELDPDDPMRLPKASKHIVYFLYDQYALTSTAFNEIDKVLQLMRDNPKLKVHLKGHTDQSGSEQYNSPLSKKRAQMVYDYMNSRGIAADRMILSSYGKLQPAVQNEDPGTAWMNRRCEMVLFEK